MKKQAKQLIGLIIALAVVVAGYFIIRYVAANQELETETINITELYHVDKESVTEVEYIHNGVDIALVRDGDTWYLKNDKSIELDQQAVGTVVGFATSLNYKTQIEEPGKLGEYGLDDPNYIVTVIDSMGVAQTYFIGDYFAIDGTYFAKLEGTDTIYTIASTYPNAFDADLEHLKSTSE